MSSYADSIGIVIDTGSQCTKAGFAGEPCPRFVFPTTVGRFRNPGLLDAFPVVYCGQRAVQMRGLSRLTWPVKNGMIMDWDEMEKLWHHTFFKELQTPPEESKVMHVVHPLVPRSDKERMAEIFFESFAVYGLYLGKSPALTLHASGRTTGVVWENGYSCSYSAPVFEGYPLRHSTVTSSLTGEVLTTALQKMTSEIGYSFTTPFEIDLLNRMKAEICYVALDYEAELATQGYIKDNKIRYELPDGQHVMIGEERFKCAELLFQPSLQNLNGPGIVDIICSSIEKCDLNYRQLFYNNVIISGGSSMFPGLTKRLTVELDSKVEKLPGVTVNIDAMSTRQFSAWCGGSIVASMSSLKDIWMTKAEYEDVGPDRVHHKFF